MLHAQGIKREPHIAAGVPHQLAHHGQVALVGADDHSAAEKVEDRTLGRPFIFADDQTRKAVYMDCLIVRLAVGGRKNATAAVLLFNDLFQFALRQTKRLFCAGELIYPAHQMCKSTDSLILSDNHTVSLRFLHVSSSLLFSVRIC